MGSPVTVQASQPYIVASYSSADDDWSDFHYWSHYPSLASAKKCADLNATCTPHHQYVLRASDHKVMHYVAPGKRKRKIVRR